MKMEKDTILKYLLDWNFWGSIPDCGIERDEYVTAITSSLKTRETIAITGIRRCGKSTIILQVLRRFIQNSDKKNTLIMNFEDPRVQNLTIQDMMAIYETYLQELSPDKHHIVALDEVQNVPRWESFVRYLHDNKKIPVLITGSNSKLLSSEFAGALSGRYLRKDIYPLSFREFLSFKGIGLTNRLDIIKQEHAIRTLFDDYLNTGGFPKIALTKDPQERRSILTAYYETIIIKDIALRYGIKETQKLEQLAAFCMANIGNSFSVNKLKGILEISLETAQRFTSYLQASLLFTFIPKYDHSIKKQIANPKKIYATDTGMRNTVAFQTSDDTGRLLENVALNELMRRNKKTYYYKTTNDLEVDFAIKNKNKIAKLIQVTKTVQPFSTRERETKSLLKGMEETGLDESYILTLEGEETVKSQGKTIRIIPLWKWLLGVQNEI